MAPTWDDLRKTVEVASGVINDYSADYDGQTFVMELENINDLDYLLDRLHECKKLKNS
jgi:hypothetical protein